MRFLIVEQHPLMRLLYCSFLREINIVHISDTSAMTEAIQRFERSSPDAILLDWSPSFPGLNFLKLVSSPRSPNRFIPVILISSYSEPHSIIEARDAGVTSFLAKQVTAALIYQQLCLVIDNQRTFVGAPTSSDPTGARVRPRSKAQIDGRRRRALTPQAHHRTP